MILVVGATGWTGREVVRNLLASGAEVRVVTRDRKKASQIPYFSGAEITIGDPTNVETMRKGFVGVTSVYLVPPTAVSWNKMEASLIDIAQESGVRHVVKLSATGVSPSEPSMSLSYHWAGEQELIRSGIAFTIVRANSFSQNTLFEAATICSDDLFYDCVGDAKFAKVDTRDIGEAVARILSEDGHEMCTYTLTGPEPLGYEDLAVRLSSALGRRIDYVDLSPNERAAQLEGTGMPRWMAKEFSDIYAAKFFRDGGGAETTDDLERLLERSPRRYDDFARDYSGSFRAEERQS